MLKSSESCHDWTIHLFLTLGSFLYLYNMRTSCLTKRVRQTRARRLCQKGPSVYRIQCRQDSGSDCNFYLLLTRRNTHIQCNQMSAVKRLNACGRGLCLCLPLEAVFMQRLCPGDITWHPGSNWVIFWGLLHKCLFFSLMMRTFWVMKLAGCIKHTKTSSMSKDQGKFGFSHHDSFNCND